MSLNAFKPKSFNNFFSKLKKTKKETIHNSKKSIKKFQKDFIEEDNLLNFLTSFITPRRRSINENSLNFSKKKNNNYVTIIKSKNDTRSTYLSKRNKTITKKNYNNYNSHKPKICSRNDDEFNKNKTSQYLFSYNNYENYIEKIESNFSPRNRYKVMKIYQSLHKNISPRLPKEVNSENSKNYEKLKHFKSEFIHLRSKKNLIHEKNNDINNEKKQKETRAYSIDKVNSIEILNKKKKLEIRDLILNKEIINNSNDKKIIKPILEKNEKNLEDDIKNDKINDQNNNKNNKNKYVYIYPETVKLYDELQKNIKNKRRTKNIFNIKENKNITHNGELNKYNKTNIMEGCLNQLYFDYSDGNYNITKNNNYITGHDQEKKIITNKNIDNNEHNLKEDLDNKKDNLIEDEGVNIKKEAKKENNNDLNQISKDMNYSQVSNIKSIENKENINIENINKKEDTIFSLDNELLDNKKNTSNINESNKSDKQKLLRLFSEENKNNLNKINFNLNYLYENKNYVNIQLLNNKKGLKTPNNKKIRGLTKEENAYAFSKLRKTPKTNIELMLSQIPRHEDKSFLFMSIQKNKSKILRRSKMIEFINKNSTIMPPNNYEASNQYF